MRIAVNEARTLAERVLTANQHSVAYARIIAEHIVDCELRGPGYGGLARRGALSRWRTRPLFRCG